MADPPNPLVFPTAGVGGSYYDTAFQVPVYPNSPNDQLTWRWLDIWSDLNINYASTQGIAAGLVWATLTYLLALTPNHKRKTAFHNFMLFGLVFLLIHLMIDMLSALTPGLQSLSAYSALTFDLIDSVWTTRFVATFAASQAVAWLALTFALVCLWLQAKNLMSGLKVRSLISYRIVSSYLVLTSMAVLGAGMAYSIHQIRAVVVLPKSFSFSVAPSYTYRLAYLALYPVCIGSYSLVSMISVVDIVWRRPSSIMTGNSTYSKALNLIGLLCAQSFVVPFIFCIIQITPRQSAFLHPEIILLSSVYAILPISSLFMTVNSAPRQDREEVEAPRMPALPASSFRCNCNVPVNARYADSETTLNSRPTPPPASSHLLDGTPIERHLRSTGEMDCGDSINTTKEMISEREAMLRDPDSQEKEVVTMKMAA